MRDRGRVDEQRLLLRAILMDLEAQAALTGPRNLVSIFFGGGTPSLMEPEWLAEAVDRVRSLWAASGPVEITLEANPTDAESARFAAYAQAGVNRLSLGVQALDDGALRFLGRNHNADQGRRAALLARGLFPKLSLDLIYARPGQSVAAWTRELNEAAALGPDHISPYQLTIEPGTAFDRAVRRRTFSPRDPEASALLFETTQSVLEGLGLQAYEVSNHARPGAEARHNLVYWRGEDYVGVGPGAHGRLSLAAGRTATAGAAAIPAYIRAVGDQGVGFETRETLTPEQAAEERLMMGLRISEGVSLAELRPLSLARLAEMTELGLITRAAGRISATPQGRLVLDSVIEGLIA